MRWLIGLDLRTGSDGPVSFARWLARASPAGDPERETFVHVLEEEHLRFALRVHHLDEVTAAARDAALRLLASAPGAREVRVVQGLHAEDSLEEERAASGADAVIVGRAAGRAGHHVVRLGRVARRLLRRLASPVAVVPPDLREDELGEGPLVALSSLDGDSVAACRLAAELAARLSRPLAVCHVARAAELPYLPSGSSRAALDAHRLETEEALARWLAAHGLRADSTAALLGSPVDGALAFAERQRAPLVLAGSRRLSTAERVFEPSIGAALAATATVPIMVVPPST